MNSSIMPLNEKENDDESELAVPFDNDIRRLEEGIELFKISKKHNNYATRTYKLDLVQHRLVASTKDLKYLKEGTKYCN